MQRIGWRTPWRKAPDMVLPGSEPSSPVALLSAATAEQLLQPRGRPSASVSSILASVRATVLHGSVGGWGWARATGPDVGLARLVEGRPCGKCTGSFHAESLCGELSR